MAIMIDAKSAGWQSAAINSHISKAELEHPADETVGLLSQNGAFWG